MKDYQKENLLRSLHELEENIDRMRDTITSEVADNLFGWTAAESVATYASRLNGYIHERRGICVALNLLGYHVNWDGNHAVSIEEKEV